MTAEVTIPRRKKLFSTLEEKEAIIIFADEEVKLEKFKQDNDFLYVTG